MGRLRSARIEDCVGRGGCHDRPLNVALVTGPALLFVFQRLGADPTLGNWYPTMKSYTQFQVSFLNLPNPFHFVSSYSHSTMVPNRFLDPVFGSSAS